MRLGGLFLPASLGHTGPLAISTTKRHCSRSLAMAQKVEDLEADLRSFRANVALGLRRLERGLERLSPSRRSLSHAERQDTTPRLNEEHSSLPDDPTCDSALESWEDVFGFFKSFSDDVSRQFETFETRIDAVKRQGIQFDTAPRASSIPNDTQDIHISAVEALLSIRTDASNVSVSNVSSSDVIPPPDGRDATSDPTSSPATPLPQATSESSVEVSTPGTEADEGRATNTPIFRCAYDDLNDGNTLDRLCQDARVRRYGFAKLEIDGLPAVAIDELEQQPGQEHSAYSSFEKVGNFVRVKEAQHDAQIETPALPYPASEKKDWTREELRHIFENILQHPAEEPVAYVIGPPLFSDIDLDAGERLRRRTALGEIKGVQSQYAYWNLSKEPVITIVHKEDGDICSLNIVRSGDYKLLLAIPPEYSKLFERHMAEIFGETDKVSKCSQFVRHISVAVLPSQLDAWAIPYRIDFFGPGQGFLTAPATYHMVVNLGPNYAVAVNYEDSSSPEMPRDYRFCDDRCAVHPITEAHWRPVRTADPVGGQMTRHSKRTKLLKKQSPSRNSAELEVADGKVGNRRKQAQQHNPPVDEVQLKRHIKSREAIVRFCHLVSAWRVLDTPLKETFRGSGDRRALLVKWSTLSGTLSQRIQLDTLLSVLTGIELARILDAKMVASDRQVSDPDDIAAVLVARGWDVTTANRRKLTNELRVPRKVMELFGEHLGLLCFTDFEGATRRQLVSTTLDTMERFQASIDPDMRKLSRVGAMFQDCILRGVEPPLFPWETLPPDQLAKATVKQLMALPAVPEMAVTSTD